jgi:hypothetical protein
MPTAFALAESSVVGRNGPQCGPYKEPVRQFSPWLSTVSGYCGDPRLVKKNSIRRRDP